MFTFSEFLLNEDLASEVTQLQMQISQITARKNQQDTPLDKQLQTLQALLAAKQKQLSAASKMATAQPTKPPAPAPAPAPAAAPKIV